MTRVLLLILSIVEITLGALGLVGATMLFFSHSAGMTMVFLPVLVIVALLLVAGAAIFVRRPWSYYTHIAIIILLGLLLVLYTGPMLGSDGWMSMLMASVLVVPLTAAFFLAPVRRYFGLESDGR